MSLPVLFSTRRRRVLCLCLLLVVVGCFYTHLTEVTTYRLSDEGYILDVLQGQSDTPRSRLDLYRFNDPAVARDYMNHGTHPWWNDPDQRMYFMRPLSSAFWAAEHWLVGPNPRVSLAQSMIWLALLVGVVGMLLFRVLPAGAAASGLVLFALSHALFTPIAWPSNRHTLIATTFAVVGVLWWIRWREDRWRPGRWLAVAAFALGLLAGETAFAALAYPFAFELFRPGGTVLARGRAVLVAVSPFLALGAAYVVLYKLFGCGVRYNWDYADPFLEPGRYLANLPRGALALLGQAITGYPRWPASWIVWIGLASVAVLTIAMYAARTLLDERGRAAVRWLLTGSLLSLVPNLAATPKPSLLVVPNIGLTAALGIVVFGAVRAARNRGGASLAVRSILVVSGLALVVGHVVVTPMSFIVKRSQFEANASRVRDQFFTDLRLDPVATEFIIVGPPVGDDVAFKVATAPPYVRLVHPEVKLEAWRELSVLPGVHMITRTGDRTLVLSVRDGGPPPGSEVFFRRDDRPLRLGQVVELDGFRAEVLEMTDDSPTKVEFRFDRSLDDPSVRFLTYEDDNHLKSIRAPTSSAPLVLGTTR